MTATVLLITYHFCNGRMTARLYFFYFFSLFDPAMIDSHRYAKSVARLRIRGALRKFVCTPRTKCMPREHSTEDNKK